MLLWYNFRKGICLFSLHQREMLDRGRMVRFICSQRKCQMISQRVLGNIYFRCFYC